MEQQRSGQGDTYHKSLLPHNPHAVPSWVSVDEEADIPGKQGTAGRERRLAADQKRGLTGDGVRGGRNGG
jgi:hypothetical protein